ncbi:MAG TPA: hypothetical protein VN660_13615 [Steroidobacteraceae bacterium]|nr:hypothetical protein [Steroidobacteraceae bacterium]
MSAKHQAFEYGSLHATVALANSIVDDDCVNLDVLQRALEAAWLAGYRNIENKDISDEDKV